MLSFFHRRERTHQGVQRTRDTWFHRVAQLFQGPALGEETWEELEALLLSADVGVATTEALLNRLRQRASQPGLTDPGMVAQLLREELTSLLARPSPDIESLLSGQGPHPHPVVVLLVGVNGSGKTTSIAKLAHAYQQQGHRVLLAATDTFRAGAIEQLRAWGERLQALVVAHRPGGDPAAVAFDALEAARAREADVALIDTAGRLHTRVNLMEELKKVRRVVQRFDPTAPHLTLLVLDATTGQNGLAQARAFTDAVGCHGVLLAKLDGTAKGGIVFSISGELGLPVLFLGTGEGLEDLSPFQPKEFVDALFTPAPARSPT